MKKLLILMLAAASISMGCQKKQETPPVSTAPIQPTPPAPAPAAAAPATDAVPPPPPEPDAAPATASAPPAPDAEPVPAAATESATPQSPELTALNKALSKYWTTEGSPPPNLEALVRKRYLPAIPNPPAGKQFFYNMSRMQVQVVDK